MPFPDTPVSACKAGVDSASAGKDLLACDAASGHGGQLLTAFSAQNYGLLSMRPRQAFDFAGRTGTISYDVDAITEGGLSWWTSLFVTEDPTIGVSNSTQVLGLLPRNGVGFNFDDPCNTQGDQVRIDDVFVSTNYVETKVPNSLSTCIATKRGSLNHIEVHLSQTSIEVWASDYSTDGGVTFPPLQKILSAPIQLGFSRGYVHFQQNERAPVKYKDEFQISPGYANNYWSRFAFDGPVIAAEVGYALPDALTPNPNGQGRNVAYAALNGPYQVETCCDATPVTLSVTNVDTSGVTRAALSFGAFYTYANTATPDNVALHYSLNGGPWRTPDPQPSLKAEQSCDGCPGPVGGGGVLYNFDVPVTDLKNGTNTILFGVDNTVNAWPAQIAGIDLLTYKE
jgi:hypothetical protein